MLTNLYKISPIDSTLWLHESFKCGHLKECESLTFKPELVNCNRWGRKTESTFNNKKGSEKLRKEEEEE